MEIKSSFVDSMGQTINVLYKDVESESDFQDKNISGVHMLCFCKDQLVVVYSESKGYWGPPGGSVENGEAVIDAVKREIKEETNMKVLKMRFIGVQDRSGPEKNIESQARAVCLVEPYGEFTHDPDGGEVTEIKLINPKDFKQYFDWGIVGDRLMERALVLKAQM